MSVLLADCEAMAPLLSAFARGTKRSRLRQLVVVCPSGHNLVEVFPTTAGLHVVWKHRARRGEFNWYALPLLNEFDADLGGAEAVPADVTAACGCTEQADIPGEDLIAWTEAGLKRVVYNAAD